MGATQGFGWQQFGKPDKAMCAWMVARLPDEIRLTLNKSERETLEWILFFAWKGEAGGKQGNSTAFLPQQYIAEQIGKSRWTIARALDKLTEMGLIRSLKRLKDKGGNWRPRLAIIQGRLSAFLQSLVKTASRFAPWCKTAPHEVPKHNKGGTTSSLQSSSPQKKEEPDAKPYTGPSLSELFLRLRGAKPMP